MSQHGDTILQYQASRAAFQSCATTNRVFVVEACQFVPGEYLYTSPVWVGLRVRRSFAAAAPWRASVSDPREPGAPLRINIIVTPKVQLSEKEYYD